MTTMTAAKGEHPLSRAARSALALAAAGAALILAGCGTSQPRALTGASLTEAQTFPYYRVYWVGPTFQGHPLAAADGLKSYDPAIGDSVYYGNCVQSKGVFGGGNCQLPLQVTTVVYALHPNAALGTQHNILVRGVPAAVYDEGRSIEIYTGRLAIDIFSDTYAHALAATSLLRPLNAPGSPSGDLPPPVYCPGLYGPESDEVVAAMAHLPHHVCQSAIAEETYTREVEGPKAPAARELPGPPP
jgi:hypothetical protein